MTGTSERIAAYCSLKPFQFNFLRRLEWLAAPLERGYSSNLRLYLKQLSSDEELVLTCENVRNFRLSAVSLVQPALEVRDVSSNQWDRINYEFRDIENDTIRFLCQTFSAAIEKTTNG
jgi:hypothetical protein